MKKVIYLFLIALIAVSCGSDSGSEYLPDSIGSPYELVVVCDNDIWETKVGDTVRTSFVEPEVMLNQPEPKFRILRKRLRDFRGLFVKHRNVFMMKVDTTMTDERNTQYIVKYNEWANPQIVISLRAKSADLLYSLFLIKEKEILSLIEGAEQSRFVKRLNKYASVEIDSTLRNMFDIGISLPKNYTFRNIIKPDFVWLSYEMPISSQGVVIYTYPYTGQQLDEKFLIEMRNKYTGRIPGQLKDTHMQCSDAINPSLEVVNLNGLEWVKMSGFWNMYNDFMGGPYRNYTTIDKKRDRIVSVDCYVFSPDGGKGQRNYIKQLNAVVETVKLY